MSWSLSTDVHPAEDIRSAIDHTQPPAHLSEDQLEQVRAAKEAAKGLLNSGALGDVNTLAEGSPHFRATLSGHRTDDASADAQVSLTVAKVQPPDSD